MLSSSIYVISFEIWPWFNIFLVFSLFISGMTNDDDGMGGHNLRCGEDDEEDDDDFYGTKVAKGIWN